jgi:hypothetical protein
LPFPVADYATKSQKLPEDPPAKCFTKNFDPPAGIHILRRCPVPRAASAMEWSGLRTAPSNREPIFLFLFFQGSLKIRFFELRDES